MDLKLYLLIDGEKKLFRPKFISVKMLRESNRIARIHYYADVDEDDNPAMFEDMVDVLVDYLVRIYNNQFTKEQLEEGMEAEKFHEVVMETVFKVMGKYELLSEGSTE